MQQAPTGWRMPTHEEQQSLFYMSKWTKRNGVKGYVFGYVNNTIFLPASGNRWGDSGDVYDAKGALLKGCYWSSSSSNGIRAYYLHCASTFLSSQESNYGSRNNAFSVRCVAE